MAQLENPEEPWLDFQKPYESDETPPELTSVAVEVLRAFNIPMVDEAGGTLKNVDLKRIGALNALKASLIDELAHKGGGLREITINPNGTANFYEVGSASSNIHPYYSLKSSAYLLPEVGVMITGGKPQQERIDHKLFPLIVEG